MSSQLLGSQLGVEPADAVSPTPGRATQGSGGDGGGGLSVDVMMTTVGTVAAAGLSAFGLRGDAEDIPPGTVRLVMLGGSLAVPPEGEEADDTGLGPDVDQGLAPLSVLRSLDVAEAGDVVHHAPVRTLGKAPGQRVFHTLTRVPDGGGGTDWYYLIGGRRPAHVYNSVYRLSSAECRWEAVEVCVPGCGGCDALICATWMCCVVVGMRLGAVILAQASSLPARCPAKDDAHTLFVVIVFLCLHVLVPVWLDI